jgi:hypothetical protein
MFSVSIVISLRDGQPGFDFRKGRIFLFAPAYRPALGPIQSTVCRACFSETKRPVLQANCSQPSDAEVKNAWSHTSASPYTCMAWCLIKLQGQLYFYLWFLPDPFHVIIRICYFNWSIVSDILSVNHLNTTGNCVYRLLWQSVILRCAHWVYTSVLYDSHCKQRLFPYTPLTSWSL